MCHRYPYNNVKLLWKFFYIIVIYFNNIAANAQCTYYICLIIYFRLKQWSKKPAAHTVTSISEQTCAVADITQSVVTFFGTFQKFCSYAICTCSSTILQSSDRSGYFMQHSIMNNNHFLSNPSNQSSSLKDKLNSNTFWHQICFQRLSR